MGGFGPETIAKLTEKAAEIRKRIIDLTVTAGGGHLGGALSMTDLAVALYYHVLKYDPRQPRWPGRDRFILSKGHCALGLYPILADVGFFPDSLLDNFNEIGRAHV